MRGAVPSGSASPAEQRHAGLRGRRSTTCWTSSKLPVNVDPGDNKLEDPAERARLARCSTAASTRRGYVLPLQVWQSADRGAAG